MARLLIVTGTEAAGKSSVAEALTRREGWVRVPAVTTRAPRAGDRSEYRFLSTAKFSKHGRSGDFVVRAEYREHKYGILSSDLERAIESGKRPIVVLTPASTVDLQGSPSLPSAGLSVFLDADDGSLDDRVKKRGGTPDLARREHDRSFRDSATYVVLNRRLSDTVEAIESLYEADGRGGILPSQWISRLGNTGLLLTNMVSSSIQAASYDLALGDEYYYAGRIQRLTADNPILTIAPYDSAIVTSHERARMPRDVAGRFDLSVGLFSQGVILSNGPQIDPGFEGNLFCLLLNTSSSPVLLRRGQHYATLVFERLIEASDSPYSGARQGKESILDYLPANAARGAINDLKQELEQLRKESARLQTFFIAALSLMFAVGALFVTAI